MGDAMKLSQGLLLLGVAAIGIGVLLFGAYSAASAPLPDGFPDPSPEGQVVSIGTRGRYSLETYQTSLERIQQWLAAHPEYAVVGQPRRFFYDGPFLPDALKRSDVQIPVQPVERAPIGE